MPFAVDFRRIVAPRLQRDCRLYALRVIAEEISFGDAMLDLLATAYRLGASRLTDAVRLDLHDTLADWLLAAVDAALPGWEAAQDRAGRVAADITRYEAEFVRRIVP